MLTVGIVALGLLFAGCFIASIVELWHAGPVPWEGWPHDEI